MIFKIKGKVQELEHEIGVANLIVKAFDKDLFFDDLLGSVITDEEGEFEIIYEGEDYQELFDNQPDLYLIVRTPEGRMLHTTEENVRCEAGKLEEFIIKIPRKILGDFAPHLYRLVETGKVGTLKNLVEEILLQLNAEPLEDVVTFTILPVDDVSQDCALAQLLHYFHQETT